MEIVGYLVAVIIGISLGLIGGGGSILTVPVLVYLFKVSPVEATSYSLIIVGFTSLVGAYFAYRQGNVNINASIIFGFPSVVGVFAARKWLIHFIPDPIFHQGGFTLAKGTLLMVLFAILMIGASYFMIKPKKEIPEGKATKFPVFKMIVRGLATGLLLGMLGAGGGFLIIPVLVFFFHQPMKVAVGTSLAIITLNSTLGALGDWGKVDINWSFLLPFLGLAILGVLLGGLWAKKVSGEKLKPIFGWFVLGFGLFILFKETLFG